MGHVSTSPTHTGRWLPHLAVGLLIAAAVVVNQSAVHWRDNLIDSHMFAYDGWCIAGGARPYVDVWDNKPPGIWWANAAGFLVSRGADSAGVAGEVLICTCTLTLTLAGFVVAAGALFHRSVLVVAAVVGVLLLTHQRYECGSNRTETFVLACEMWVIAGYVRWLGRTRTRGRWVWLVVAGVAGGLAPFFKQSGLAASAACAVHLAWLQVTGRRPRHASPWIAAGGACAAVVAGGALALAWTGSLAEAWFAVFRFNRAYFAVHDATWMRMDRAFLAYRPVLVPILGVFVLVTLAATMDVFRLSRARRRDSAPKVDDQAGRGAIWWWLLLSAYLAFVSPGRQEHHLMPVLGPLTLLILIPLDALARPSGFAARLVRSPLLFVPLTAGAYLLGLVALDGLQPLPHAWRQKLHWYSLATLAPRPYEFQAAAIRRLTSPGELIYVWGFSPGTYRFAFRRCPSRFATLEKPGQVGQHAQFIVDEVRAALRRDPPAVLVIAPDDWDYLTRAPTDDFGRWLTETYEWREDVGGMQIRQFGPAGTR